MSSAKFGKVVILRPSHLQTQLKESSYWSWTLWVTHEWETT